jgi:hypothetical protein
MGLLTCGLTVWTGSNQTVDSDEYGTEASGSIRRVVCQSERLSVFEEVFCS